MNPCWGRLRPQTPPEFKGTLSSLNIEKHQVFLPRFRMGPSPFEEYALTRINLLRLIITFYLPPSILRGLGAQALPAGDVKGAGPLSERKMPLSESIKFQPMPCAKAPPSAANTQSNSRI